MVGEERVRESRGGEQRGWYKSVTIYRYTGINLGRAIGALFLRMAH